MHCGTTRRQGLHIVLWCLALLEGSARAEQDTWSWPQFRGPDRNGMSKDSGLLDRWPESGPNLRWSKSGCGNGFSSVSVKDGFIYTAGSIDKKTYVIAFNLDGELQWKSLIGSRAWKVPEKYERWAQSKYDGARGTPTVNDGLIYHLDAHGRLGAVNAKTGDDLPPEN